MAKEKELAWDGRYLKSGQWKLVLGEVMQVAENVDYAKWLHRQIQEQLVALGFALPHELRNWETMTIEQRLIFLRIGLRVCSGVVMTVGTNLDKMTEGLG